MDFVLAKVKRLRKDPFQKLLSDTSIFKHLEVDLAHCTVFESDHNLDENEWFKVENFSNQDFCIDLIRGGHIDSKDFNELKRDKFIDIVFLCSIQNGNLYFQKVTPSTFVNKKSIFFGEHAMVENETSRILVNSKPDAVYFKEGDTLVFRDLSKISSLFKGIDQLFREATKEEAERFLDLDFIEVPENYGYESISKPNLKRIGLAMKSLFDMNDDQKQNLLDYITVYCNEKITFNDETEKFVINNDHEMKLLLYGIEQRYYTTELSHEKRLANSVKPMD